MDAVPKGKGYDKQLSNVIMVHLRMSDESYYPIFCEGITVEIFLTHLLLLNSHGAANMEKGMKEATNKKKTKEAKTLNEIVHIGSEKKPVSLEFLKSYGGHRSALTYYFHRCKYVPPKSWQDKLSQAMKGLNNRSARARAASGKKLGEGKSPMSFDLYRKLCQWLIELDDANAAYAHCFLTLTWNLMCSSRSTVNLQYEHVGWYNDAMGIKFGHNKSDQEGKLQWKVRHIYANPQMPEICPILSFARWRVHQNGVTSGPVFPGSKQYDRFRRILGEICESHQSSIDMMGLYYKDIGVHSIRKGAATY
jgi:hypothetical protein